MKMKTFNMCRYLKFLIIFIIIDYVSGNNFVVVASEKSFFQPCDKADNGGNKDVSDLVDFNLRHEYADDMETLISNGNVTVKFDMPPNELLKLDLEIYEWKRGKWEKTIYSVRRDDFCGALFSTSELWSSLAMQIKEEDRACPPEKGKVYHVDNIVNRVELNNIIGLDLEGKYKLIAHFIVGQFSTCIASIVNVWKN